MMHLQFHVPGIPAPQGSMRAPSAGVVLHNSPKVLLWRNAVAWAALNARQDAGEVICENSVTLTVDYYFPRPRRIPKKVAFPMHITKPDLDKLDRAIGDALTGVVWKDDAQVVAIISRKHYVTLSGQPEPGAYITVAEMD